MAAFVLLTRLSPEALHQPRSFETRERHVEIWPAMPRQQFNGVLHALAERP